MTDSRKIKHKITTRHSGGEVPTRVYRSLIRQAIMTTLRSEGVDMLCVVNVLITDDEGIREFNNRYRGIDKATDVLSFPMQVFLKAGWGRLGTAEPDEDSGELPLGDIILSTETVKKHGRKYKNSMEKETTYMMIHSTLHLLGYDHDNNLNEKIMHNKKELIMKEMGYFD